MESAKALCRILERYYQPGMSLLDVGCGCGHYLRSLRKRLDENIDYRGVDKTSHYIELAEQAFPGEGRFQVAEAEALPFPDRSIDVVLCINVVPNLPPPVDRAFRELIRVGRHVLVIRTLFADLNYIVQELDAADGEETGLIRPDGTPAPERSAYNNMYTESYYRSVIRAIDPTLEPAIEPDDQWQGFDNSGPGSTRGRDGQQIAGPLMLDWRFIIIGMSR